MLVADLYPGDGRSSGSNDLEVIELARVTGRNPAAIKRPDKFRGTDHPAPDSNVGDAAELYSAGRRGGGSEGRFTATVVAYAALDVAGVATAVEDAEEETAVTSRRTRRPSRAASNLGPLMLFDGTQRTGGQRHRGLPGRLTVPILT